MNEKLNAFLDKLIENKKLREEFALDPKGVLAKEKIDLPAEYIPAKIDASKLEERLNALQILSSSIKPTVAGGLQLDKASIFSALSRPSRIIPNKGGVAHDTIITTN